MVPLMSLVGTLESTGFTIHVFTIRLQTVVLNFIIAYPLQIFGVGPLCRWIFRILFRGANPYIEKQMEKEMIDDGYAE